MAKNTYAERQRQGLCPGCGNIRDEPSHILCSVCRKRNADELRRRRALEAENRTLVVKRSITHEPAISMKDIMAYAKNRGISYGYAVAELEGRMKTRTTFHYGGVTHLHERG